MYGLGLGVGAPSDRLWSKTSNCSGVDSPAIVGMICTQYRRQFLVCPRAISTHVLRGTVMGTAAMACRTVSGVGPSDSLHLSIAAAGGAVGFPPQPDASRISKMTISRRTR